MSVEPDCLAFRVMLEQALVGRPVPAELTALSWHEHLLFCGDCRELLEQEEALEVLLATLPEPKLPPDLTRRVLTRLVNSVALERLLDLDPAEPVPAGLASRVLAGLAASRGGKRRPRAENAPPVAVSAGGVSCEQAHTVVPQPPRRGRRPVCRPLGRSLDGLLSLDEGEPVPEGLAAGVLAATAPERARIAALAALDALLDRYVVSAPREVPDRVLAAVAGERRRSRSAFRRARRAARRDARIERRRAVGSPLSRPRSLAALALAAVLALLVSLRALFGGPNPAAPRADEGVARIETPSAPAGPPDWTVAVREDEADTEAARAEGAAPESDEPLAEDPAASAGDPTAEGGSPAGGEPAGLAAAGDGDGSAKPAPPDPAELEATALPPSDEMLGVLPLLEEDLIWGASGLDIDLSISLGEGDELLLDLEAAGVASEEMDG